METRAEQQGKELLCLNNSWADDNGVFESARGDFLYLKQVFLQSTSHGQKDQLFWTLTGITTNYS